MRPWNGKVVEPAVTDPPEPPANFPDIVVPALARLAEKRGSVTPSSQGTYTPTFCQFAWRTRIPYFPTTNAPESIAPRESAGSTAGPGARRGLAAYSTVTASHLGQAHPPRASSKRRAGRFHFPFGNVRMRDQRDIRRALRQRSDPIEAHARPGNAPVWRFGNAQLQSQHICCVHRRCSVHSRVLRRIGVPPPQARIARTSHQEKSAWHQVLKSLQKKVSMKSKELQRWLKQRGCYFESHKGGSGYLTVRRGDRTSQIPMHGSRRVLGTKLIAKIKRDLGL